MRTLATTIFCLATPAFADVPNVVTDIAPVRSIVSQIMAGAGDPAQIIPAGASPHGYSMRPSEAQALSKADLIVWVGPGLTGWLEAPLVNLAPDAEQMILMDVPGVVQLGFRERALFAPHAHGHHEGESEDAEHDDHENHAEHDDHDDHADDEGHEDHDDLADHDGHEDHADHATDPHVWLDPRNVQVWAEAIARHLATLDPERADLYRSNAATLIEQLESLEEEIDSMLAPVRAQPYLVLHDGYHYFEARFDIEARGSVFLGDGRSPGPARLQALREAIAASPVVCAFAEPQMDTALLTTATEGSAVRIATLDPLGTDDTSYADLMRGIADSLLACLSEE
ncbi:zinc ABC transporter substrate-binding protein [uncultured Sulfitobacter sp.]|uniref:zinc ABC transporter substrate-binding protein n=1 Tax=uncultured Sulfitobacter sp. TaxID=191468 RepID=UPI0026362332|nr:zinc ABC transporter substrate-binding protein [uncultured Sulfitobacter sp.]